MCPITNKEIKCVVKSLLKKGISDPDGSTHDFCQTLKEKISPILSTQSFPKS